MLTAEEFYEENVKALPASERLKLAALILNALSTDARYLEALDAGERQLSSKGSAGAPRQQEAR